MYKIHIQELEFETIIGILDFERVKPQKVIVEVEIEYLDKKNFIDYAQVVEHIKTIMIKREFALIEDALDSLTISLKEKFSSINQLRLKITKPKIVPNCKVSVESLKFF